MLYVKLQRSGTNHLFFFMDSETHLWKPCGFIERTIASRDARLTRLYRGVLSYVPTRDWFPGQDSNVERKTHRGRDAHTWLQIQSNLLLKRLFYVDGLLKSTNCLLCSLSL